MANDASNMFRASPAEGALRQGEILSDVIELCARRTHDNDEHGSPYVVDERIHEYTCIISQDCDLDWDFRARQLNETAKILPKILLLQVQTAEETRNSTKEKINAAVWARIKINNDPRYQFLSAVDPKFDSLGQGVPELCIDFKRVYAMEPEEIYWQLESGQAKRRTQLNGVYAPHLSQRFCSFWSRVALPEDHESIPVA